VSCASQPARLDFDFLEEASLASATPTGARARVARARARAKREELHTKTRGDSTMTSVVLARAELLPGVVGVVGVVLIHRTCVP
jgi:hypothetical protein